MNLIFRLIRTIVLALLGPRLHLMDTSVLTFRVWPTDLDANLHMNNGRYLTVMDLGRVDLMVRAGIARPMMRRKWRPVLGGAVIRFRRSLALFQRCRLVTRTLCWDDRWVYMEQRFETLDGTLVAVAVVKGLFTGPTGPVPTGEVVRALGLDLVSPPIPADVAAWREAEREITDRAKAA